MPGLMELLSYAGNALDLPASSWRDLFAGSNPFDQWATPFTSDNRTSGRDMLNPIFGKNKETGMSGWLDDPMDGVADILGFGAEMVLDPLNFISGAGVMKALMGRKAAKSANKVIAAENATNAGKYGYVNAKLAGQADQADDLVNPITQQAPVDFVLSDSQLSPVKDKLEAAYRMLVSQHPEINSRVRKILESNNFDPGDVNMHIVGGRTKGKPITADSDMDLIFGTQNPLNSRSVDPLGRMDDLNSAHQAINREVWSRYGGDALHVLNVGKGSPPGGVRVTPELLQYQAPQKLLGHTPPQSMNIADRLQEAAKLRKQRDEFFQSKIVGRNENIVSWEEMRPVYAELDSMENGMRAIDPTLDDRIARFHSKPIVGVSRDEWLAEVGEKNQALKKLLRGLDMSQPDDQMILKNLGSAFDGSADPFAESGPLMNTMRQFASDVADADIAIVEPIYEAVNNPKFLDLAKRTAESAGVEVDDRFDQWLPELFHEGPTSRQARMFKGMREGIPKILDETPADDPTRAMMEQILNVANIYRDPMDAAKFEYDRQLAKFSTNMPNPVQKNPMLPMQQVQQPVARAVDSPLMSTMNPMRPLQQLPGLAAPAATSAVYNVLARQNNYGGIM